ncbi:dehydrogenase/reductase SDR family member 13 precursor [Pyricularia oryzae]|uniref:Dehydrogenase/reductase SDR family member 13 n=2 Tax=Pyricularia oryzae TaxID=318829 RepID=A0AA97PA86_PYRO3|nr:dehydrogenase/reductase SDR family member 13 precursor [Pyricularia oryzae Y34]KAI7914851.1 dehydrogenase/reductase SDR family member 13 precursor [Pyricularia oryzae]KAI7915545.1 dehydrogenase/reductase SDR family member 13 precursor [Pyricularia oryzae]
MAKTEKAFTNAEKILMAKAWIYGIRPFFKHGKNFNPTRDIPPQTGKTMLVTGGASGIGAAFVAEIARHSPAQVWIADLRPEAAEKAISAISAECPDVKIDFLQIDLGDAESVKRAASEFLSRTERLDVLLNNAGILPAKGWTTKDGYESMFGVNFVGHARLTELLLPRLMETAAIPGADVRVVSVASGGHGVHPKPDGVRLSSGGALLKEPTCGGMTAMQRYAQSKLAVILWVRRLAREFPAITIVSAHPGTVATSIANDLSGSTRQPPAFFVKLTGTKTPEMGCYNQLWCATAPRDQLVSGKYYCPVGLPDQEFGIARDRKKADELEERLWVWLQKELKGDSFVKVDA